MRRSITARRRALVYTAIGLIVVLNVASGITVDIAEVRRLAIADTVIAVFAFVFDRWLWRLKPVASIFRTGPVIRGTWRATIKPVKGQPISGFLAVSQTFSSVGARLLTDESASTSINAALLHSDHDSIQLAYQYRNEPRQAEREDSPMHNGAVVLTCGRGMRPTQMSGFYFTDRESRGGMELEFLSDTPVVTIFEAINLK